MPRPVLRHALFGLINFALTAPGIYLWIGLPLVMRQHGWSGAEIGVFQLAGLPAVFKLFLALPVQHWQPRRRPHVRWAWLTGGCYLVSLLALAALNIDSGKAALFVFTLSASLFATWADIPVNALAIQLFPPTERPLAGSIRSAVTFAGAIVGGGVMLLVEQALGWSAPFFLLAGFLVLALALLGFVDEGDAVPAPERVSPFAGWRSFFRETDARTWGMLLIAYYPPVAVAWIYLKPLLLDHGFAAGEVAWIAGIGGSVLGALTSLAAGFLPRQRLAAALPWSAAVNALAVALLAVAAAQGSSLWLLAATALLAIAMGVASALAFALMMEFARSGRHAADYGLQSSIFTFGRVVAAALAGWLLDRYGHPGMLGMFAALALLVCLLIGVRPRFGFVHVANRQCTSSSIS
ncbi:MFS transporter [Diaphorobacter sp.]|uniref:MFS transporter n=1 Tax=Diaphorobacter sp. TaxID=1934310 RepID=UPI00258B5965|nr:MFS transporter [Diaphorobacter sp.]